jgi:hypothetical protein
MENRDKLENHGEKLKKILQKQELDRQIAERTKYMKNHADAEVLINKKILSTLGYPIPTVTQKSTESP